ncbi:hypothetical protein EVAR_64265_1 [Eumeta japonica]|uniref:Reverse transcriptase domain-containing protein n=1 Tax=Eumeta variegata TaxID=151549 RepID=A0A4C1YX97_EUMVA|nr:hypothetical protein EVAR_64265_1 [Eumeta japonica]
MNDAVKKRGIKVNIGKTKVMVFERGESMTECDIVIEGEKVGQVKELVYLGSLFTNDGKHDRDMERKVNAGNKVNGDLLAISHPTHTGNHRTINTELIKAWPLTSASWTCRLNIAKWVYLKYLSRRLYSVYFGACDRPFSVVVAPPDDALAGSQITIIARRYAKREPKKLARNSRADVIAGAENNIPMSDFLNFVRRIKGSSPPRSLVSDNARGPAGRANKEDPFFPSITTRVSIAPPGPSICHPAALSPPRRCPTPCRSRACIQRRSAFNHSFDLDEVEGKQFDSNADPALNFDPGLVFNFGPSRGSGFCFSSRLFSITVPLPE